MKNTSKTLPAIPCLIVIALLVIAVVVLLLLPGRSEDRYELTVVPMEVAEAETDPASIFTTFSNEDLGGNCPSGMSYSCLKEVNVTASGRTMALSDAIRQGVVSVDALIAQAREDSRGEHPLCKETYTTEYGVTTFAYRYDDYTLYFRRDVLVSPNGEEHLMDRFVLAAASYESSVHLGYTELNKDGTWVDLLQENWGLEFRCDDVTAETLTLHYTHSGGQQAGDLYVTWAGMHRITENGWEKVGEYTALSEEIPIQANYSDSVAIDIAALFGTLEPGEYCLQLRITDRYDPAQLHPLQAKYQDAQTYSVFFTVS